MSEERDNRYFDEDVEETLDGEYFDDDDVDEDDDMEYVEAVDETADRKNFDSNSNNKEKTARRKYFDVDDEDEDEDDGEEFGSFEVKEKPKKKAAPKRARRTSLRRKASSDESGNGTEEKSGSDEQKNVAERKSSAEQKNAAERKSRSERKVRRARKERVAEDVDENSGSIAPEKEKRQSERSVHMPSAIQNMNLPNKLTCLRMILIVPFVLFMLLGRAEGVWRWFSLVIFCAAAITDAFDGHIARRDHLITDFGKFMDPLADKLLVVSAMICLVDLDRMPAWILIVIIAREFAISGFRLIASDNGVVIAANIWGKAKTVSQMAAVILLIVNPAAGLWHTITLIVLYAALVLTVVSLVDYIYKNKQVLSMQK